MNNQMEMHKSVGILLANLQSLEFVLRIFLSEVNKRNNPAIKPNENIDNLKVGDEIEEDPITNYDSLNQIINKVNAILLTENIKDQMDISVVDTRDALAHGRISSINPNGPFHLLKFSKPCCGKVKVTMSFDMTMEWATEQIRKSHSEVMKVKEISKKMGFNIFPEEP